MYFIYDCNNSIIGNPKGYRTYRGASQQASGKTKVKTLIWDRFHGRDNKKDTWVSAIKLVDKK